jgi:hypothetical protein
MLTAGIGPLQRHGGDQFDYRVGRAMFETTSLPAGWLESMRAMDEIWVPSHFGREVFLKASACSRSPCGGMADSHGRGCFFPTHSL